MSCSNNAVDGDSEDDDRPTGKVDGTHPHPVCPAAAFLALPHRLRRSGFRRGRFGNKRAVLWIPFLFTVALIAFVFVIFWSAWEPFRDDLTEDPWVMIPLVVLLGAVVLLPPLAWAIELVA